MKTKLKKSLFVILLCSVFTLPKASASLTSRIDSIVSRNNLRNVKFGIEVIKAETSEIVYRRNSKLPLIPASNMKIVTSAVALEFLGKDYQFETSLAIIDKSLVIIGGGDPLLCDDINDAEYGRGKNWLFDDIIKTLKSKGIDNIENVIIDSTFFDNVRVHQSWPESELNRPYSCEVSGLNFNRNCIAITVRRSGSSVRVSTDPDTDYITIINQVRLKSSGSSAVAAYRNKTPNKLTLKGKCRTQTSFEVAIEGPATFFGTVLSERLEAAGINISGSVSEKYIKNDPGLKILKVYRTPLTDVLDRCNKDSFNLAAESLVKTLSAENTSGRVNGEWEHGFVLAGRYLNRLGVDNEDFVFEDGCGLSRKNRLTADAIARVLFRMYYSDNQKAYIDSLAIGGVEGTAAKYFKEPKYKGKVFAKTGYISGVRSFSGYAKTGDGDYIFSILTEGGGYYVRMAINEIVKAMF